MSEKILIVEDELLVAKDLEIILENAGYEVCGIARSVPEALTLIANFKPSLVLLDIFLKGEQTGIDLAPILNEQNIAFVYLSANSNQSVMEAAKVTKPYGFMVKPYREEEVLISLEIARYRHQNSQEAELRKELILRQQLSQIQLSSVSAEQKLLAIAIALQTYIPFDYIELGKGTCTTSAEDWFSFLRIGYSEYQTIRLTELIEITGLKESVITNLAIDSGVKVEATIRNDENFRQLIQENPLKLLFSKTFHVHSNLNLPLFFEDGRPFLLSFYSKNSAAYDSRMIQFLENIRQALTGTVSAILSSPIVEPETVKSDSFNKDLALKAKSGAFPGIIGKSQPLLSVLSFVEQVAGVDTSVLILGETGTGKEKIAQHIHQLSPRSKKPLIKVNCAALPLSLIESELFGHEKGSFTGAIAQRSGKFEQANGGTIFLDEIGDVPLEVQVKLLRILQEKEIERIGGRDTIKIDVRVIAATNKNLEKEVAEGRFRMDLYYRLNVFPIELPSLRERPEDIPLLVAHFIEVYSNRHGKQVSGISQDAIAKMGEHNWPGNVRELENAVERAIVLTAGNRIENIFIGGAKADAQAKVEDTFKTIEQVEREHIQKVLEKCNHKVYGPGGAAELLNLPPSTLTSKMKKLGISKD